MTAPSETIAALRETALRATADLDKLYEWMREPDWAEDFTQAELLTWINARPCATPLAAQNVIGALLTAAARAVESEAEIAALKAENGRLREAIDAIKIWTSDPVVQKFARAALQPAGDA